MEDACLSFSLIIPLMENAPTHTNSSSYAAFISYRHLPRDAEVACEVQRAIEEYRLPRLVARANAPAETTSNTACAFPEADAYAEIAHKEAILHTENASIGTTTHNKDTFNAQEHKVRRPTKLGKCFRDEDELAASHSLPDSIREALAASRTLIVICSPETQESSWVRREIEMFEQIHGRERIICVLAAGSPEESIPPILKTRMVPDANGVLREMPAEPLAADLRPEAKTKRKAELLRIIAAVAGCSYDDLRQRERARQCRRMALASAAAALTIAAVGVFAFQFHQTSEAALIAESKSLAAQALDQYDRGEHLQAIETALAALPSSADNPNRPIVPEAQAALEEVLALNPDPDRHWVSLFCIDAKGSIVDIAYSFEGGWLAVLDDTGALSIYDIYTSQPITTESPTLFAVDEDTVPQSDWFIEAISPSHLLLANRTEGGGVSCLLPLTGKEAWNSSRTYALAAAPLDDSSDFAILAYGMHSLGAAFVNCTKGSLEKGLVETPVEQFPQFTNFEAFSAQKNPSTAYYALDTSLVIFDLEEMTCEQRNVSDAMIHSIRAGREIVVFTAADCIGDDINTNQVPFTVRALDTSTDSEEPLWTFNDTYSVTVGTQSGTLLPFNGIPQVRCILHKKESMVAITAGKKLLVFNLKTGELLFSHEFNASIVEVSLCFDSDDSCEFAVALGDGTLDIVNPLMEITLNTDYSATQIPYHIDSASFDIYDTGNPVAFVHPTNRSNRLLCYLFNPYYGEDDIEEFSLEELLAYARSALRYS